jgi:Domain of unknown function (DUF4386)
MERSENARLPHATAARDVTDMPRLAPAPEVTATKTLARIAGLRYLIVAVRGGFREPYVRSNVRVPGDAAATAANVVEHATPCRIGLVTDFT